MALNLKEIFEKDIDRPIDSVIKADDEESILNELEEYVIWDRQIDYNNMKTLGYPYVFRFNKVHEFICIYWKR